MPDESEASCRWWGRNQVWPFDGADKGEMTLSIGDCMPQLLCTIRLGPEGRNWSKTLSTNLVS